MKSNAMSSLSNPDQGLPAAAGMLGEWYDRMPALAGAVAIVLLGWIAARLARSGSRHVANYFNRLLDRAFRSGGLAAARIPGSANVVIGEVLFWVVFVFALVIAARVAGVAVFSTWLDGAVVHFPHAVIGVLIIIAGWVVAARVGIPGANPGRRLVQATILSVTMIVGLEQMGLDMALPVVLLAVGLAAVLFAFSLAFGLGAQRYVAAAIAGRTLSRHLNPGVRVRVGEFEGELIEQTTTHLLLDGDDGQILVPLAGALDVAIVIPQVSDMGSDEHE